VRFLYRDEEPSVVEKKVRALNGDELSGLPRELTDDLAKAVELLDSPLILDVIRRIDGHDHELGERLRRMAEELRYKELLRVLDDLAKKRTTQ
jgi:hypothetical protein